LFIDYKKQQSKVMINCALIIRRESISK
jgi:hypothetical protein